MSGEVTYGFSTEYLATIECYGPPDAIPDSECEARDHFAGCPHCPPPATPESWYNVGKAHFCACHTHRVMWYVGANLLKSSWLHDLDEAGGDWDEMIRRQHERISECHGYLDLDSGRIALYKPGGAGEVYRSQFDGELLVGGPAGENHA